MRYDVFRLAGTATWIDRKGDECHGYDRLDKVGEVEARTVQEAMDRARSLLDPSPILQPRRVMHRPGVRVH